MSLNDWDTYKTIASYFKRNRPVYFYIPNDFFFLAAPQTILWEATFCIFLFVAKERKYILQAFALIPSQQQCLVFKGPDFGYVTREPERKDVSSLDSFGNLEVSPPVTVDGRKYPLGRILIGVAFPTWVCGTSLFKRQTEEDKFLSNVPVIFWFCFVFVFFEKGLLWDGTWPK